MMPSNEVLVLLLVLTWLAGGVFVAVVMGRAGHDFKIWLGVGVLLGPLSGWFALDRLAHVKPRPSLDPSEVHTGQFDVLVGIDGSEDSVKAARSALRLLSDRLTSVTLVTVLDHDSSGSFTRIGPRSEAYDHLVEVAEEIGYEPFEVKLLYGRPATEMAAFAESAGIELIVVGARGHGLSEAVFGSVTADLIGDSKVPVLVGPSDTAHAT